MQVHQNPNSFWSRRIDIFPDDPDQNWHSLEQEGTAYHLDGLQHLNLAKPVLQELYATGARLKLKVGLTWDVTTNTGDETEHFMQLVPMNMHALESYLQPASRELPWGGIMSRIRSDARNRMEHQRSSRSNLVFHRISKIEVHAAPQGGTPYLGAGSRAISLPDVGGTYTELPKALAAKQACINIQNRDHRCFQYCIMNWYKEWYKENHSQLWPRKYCCYASDGAPIAKRHRQNDAFIPVDVGLDFSMLGGREPFPVPDIYKFETANAPRVGVYVYTWHTLDMPQEDRTTEVVDTWVQIRAPDECTAWETEVKLMLIDGHYSLIHDFNRLAGFQGQGYKKCKIIGINNGTNTSYHCHRCGSSFKSTAQLQRHLTNKLCCMTAKDEFGNKTFKREFTFPEPTDKWGRKSVFAWKVAADMCMHPCVVYADLEAFTEPTDRMLGPKTRMVAAQDKIASIGYHAVGRDGFVPTARYKSRVMFACHDALNLGIPFLFEMLQLANEFLLTEQFGINWQRGEQELHTKTEECMYCNRCFTQARKKCADHNHLTGDYRGAACNTCNLAMKLPRHLVIMFHNLKGYDGHFIVRSIMELQSKFGDQTVCEAGKPQKIRNLQFTPIQESGEKYSMIKFGPLRFIDTFSYLQTSLEKAIDAQRSMVGATIDTYHEAFPEMAEHHTFMHGDHIYDGDMTSEDCLELLTRKIKMPFSAMNSPAVFEEPPALQQSAYDSALSKETCDDKDYAFIKEMAARLKMTSFKNYLDCYQQTDVLALADIMESVRTAFHGQFRVDPVRQASAQRRRQ